MVSAVSVLVSALNAGISSSISIGLKCGVGTSLFFLLQALAISQMIFYMGWSKLLILSENFHYYLRLAQNLWAASETHGIEVSGVSNLLK